jgi:hypothetical protein
MRNSIFFFIGLITLFASCTPDTIETIEPVDYDVDIPFDPENENDLPSDTGGFIGSISVGDGFNIKLDTMINDLPSDVSGFNPVSEITNFQTTQSGQDLFISFDAINDLEDKYTFIIYNWETQEVLGGFMLRGGANHYKYRLVGLPSETNLLIWGYINQGFGQEYLGGSWIWLDSNN